MFSKSRKNPHQRTSSSSTTTDAAAATRSAIPIEAVPISPLQMTFDFELPDSSDDADFPSPFSPKSPDSSFWRQHNDAQGAYGSASRSQKPHGGLSMFPSSTTRSNSSSARRIMSGDSQETGWNAGDTIGRHGGGGSGAAGGEEGGKTSLVRKQSVMSHRLSTNFNFDDLAPMPPLSNPPVPYTQDERPKTAHGIDKKTPSSSSAKMEASLFPAPSDTLVMPQTASQTLPPMNRSFIDSRDKPYSQPAKPFATLQANHSSPDLVSANGKTPVSVSRGPTPIYSNRSITPQASLQDFGQRSNYSGSTARPSTRASSRTALSSGVTTTIGVPYGATADSYPLPQHVKTRPKTPGATSSVAGVVVPTHHTSAIKSTAKPASKSESRKSVAPKKKGRLLNPMLLLQRRRSSQDPDAVEAERANREAQAQAVARQRDVLASGLNIPPPDFDPRIKGKVVHDFSAPREKRHTFDETEIPQPPNVQHTYSNGQPLSPTFPPRQQSLVNRGNRSPRDGQRRSTHTPVFRENLDENLETSKRLSSIHAENLENKEFLQRASKHSNATAQSQESSVLPPFARRSQMLDPVQASFFQDDESKRSSDPSSQKGHDSPLSDTGEISPLTARSSGHDAISPISASATSPHGSRPVSHINTTLADLNGSRSLTSDRAIEKMSRPYSVVLAPPQIDTIAEASVDSSPIEPVTSRANAQEPQYLARGVSIRNSPSPGAPETSIPTPTEWTPEADAESPSTEALLSRTTGIPTPEQIPELVQDAATLQAQRTPPKLVEKRASAVGHSRKSATLPKKNASNASRFSFQFGGESAAQEHALEEKHRKIVSKEITDTVMGVTTPGEDEDDYFDEDAMDDMDELEMQASPEEQPQPMLHPQSKPGDGSISNAGTSQSSLYLQQARQALQQPDSDGDSLYDDDMPQVTDEQDLPYAEHPAFRAHSAMGGNSRHNSMMPDAPDGYWRDSTIDSYMRDSYYPTTAQSRASRTTLTDAPAVQNPGYAQDYLSALDRDSQRFSRPQAPNLSVPAHASSLSTPPTKPVLPHRDSGNSERNRAVSGFSFSTPGATPSSERVDPLEESHEPNRVVSGVSQSTVGDDKMRLQASSSQTTPKVAATNFSQRSSTSISSPKEVTNQPELQRKGSANTDRLSSYSNKPFTPSIGDQKNSEHSSSVTSPNPPRNESASAFSSSSQSRSAPSNPSMSSDLSFEDFTRNGFARGTSPITPGEGHFDRAGFNSIEPRISKGESDLLRIGSPSSKSRSSPPKTSGLGLSNFAEFDFGHSLTSMPLGTTVVDASDSEDESQDVVGTVLLRHGRQSADSHVANAAQTSNASEPNADTYGRQSTSKSSSPEHSKSTSVATTSPVSAWRKSPEILRQRFGSPPFSTSPRNEQNRVNNASSPPTDSQLPTMPSAGRNVANHFPAKASPQSKVHDEKMNYDDGQDDMYFDDGNFGVDFGEAIPTAGGFDESAFDDDSFLYRPNAAVNAPQGYGHRQKNSNMSIESIGSDGPYPSFAVPNASKALARNSQLMLEDLPIHAPVDPKYIPQRNPSEDAKRLGTSDRAPPVPVSEATPEALQRMQNSLQKYHAALADAANRAANEGRFVRQPSAASTVASSVNRSEPAVPQLAVDTQNLRDDVSLYSQNEDGREIPMPYGNGMSSVDRSGTQVSHLSHNTGYSPQKMSFDFGFDHSAISDFGDFNDEDDDLVAAANAEVLASDDEGFYGQEFEFYGRPRASSIEAQAINGGFFGPDGDDGLQRNKSLREPNLTPITERSEFSTRSSFVAGMPGYLPSSAGGFGHHSPALSRMPITPLMEHDITSFDELRRLRAHAFGGSSRSDKSSSNRSSQHSFSLLSPTIDTSVAAQGYLGSSPMQYGYSNVSSGSSNPSSAKPLPMDPGFNFHDSPQSATSSNGNSFALDIDATPRRNVNSTEPVTAKKAPPRMMSPTSPKSSHSRNGSGADSITYVQEPDSEGSGRPRWVLERRRTSEAGQLELVGRELVQGGWI